MAALLGCVIAGPACARTLEVGPGTAYHTLADAVAHVGEGDTIHLPIGEFYECATLRAPNLVLQGSGPGTVLTDKTCVGKALLVADADNLTVRDLVLARARVPDMNGAGIRLEAQGLVVERVRFENDEVGVLAVQPGPGTVVVSDCVFHAGGIAGNRPSAALWVGDAGGLVVERSTFEGVKGGQINSNAGRTELIGNRIQTGVEPGAGAAVLQGGGTLLMRDNVLEVGPNPPPRNAAVLATGAAAELRGNRLENNTGREQRLLLDWTQGGAVLASNVVDARDTEVSSEGSWRHQAGGAARGIMGDARAAMGRTKQLLKGLIGR